MESLNPPISFAEIFLQGQQNAFTEMENFSFVIVNLAAAEKNSEWQKFLRPEEQHLPVEKALSKALTRFGLSQKLQQDPLELQFENGKNGRPSVVGGQHISFNVSHSDDLWALAFSPSKQLGIDLETWKSWDRLEKIASRIFTENENFLLAAIDDLEKRIMTALQLWTLKEAMVKLEGGSLFEGLAQFEFLLSPSRCLQRPEVQFTHITWDSRFCLTVATQ